jgi:hypothetical protein
MDLFLLPGISQMWKSSQEMQLTAEILVTVLIELLEYPSVSHFERLVEPAEKNETSRFSRNWVNWTSFTPFTDISAGRGSSGGPPPAILVSGHGAQLARVAKYKEMVAKI